MWKEAGRRNLMVRTLVRSDEEYDWMRNKVFWFRPERQSLKAEQKGDGKKMAHLLKAMYTDPRTKDDTEKLLREVFKDPPSPEEGWFGGFDRLREERDLDGIDEVSSVSER